MEQFMRIFPIKMVSSSSSALILALIIQVLCVFACGTSCRRMDTNWIAPLVTHTSPHKPVSASSVPVLSDRYIVHLKRSFADGFTDGGSGNGGSIYPRSVLSVLEAHRQMLLQELSSPDSGSSLDHTFDFDGFIGYSGEFEPSLLDKIRRDPAVEMVEQDQAMWAFDMDSCAGDGDAGLLKMRHFPPVQQSLGFVDSLVKLFKRKAIMKQKEIEVILGGAISPKNEGAPKLSRQRPRPQNCFEQCNAPWGLSRVSEPLNSEHVNGTYWYPKSAGSNVDVYIVDTGINIEHVDFEGRARWGTTVPQFDMDIDGNGHGTHCAGIVGGKTYGVAKNASLVAVKVLRTNGFGTNADVIKGIEWVLNQDRIASRHGKRSVINMSLGGGKSLALERAIESCIESGIHVAVAAGNDNTDACNYSPAASRRAITVGASTRKDKMAYFSNIGPCVDIFAPGLEITSTWIGSKAAVNTISGTSMASPHVAGVLALYLAEKSYSPEDLKALLIDSAVDEALELLPLDTVNKLLSTHSLLASLEERDKDEDEATSTSHDIIGDLFSSPYQNHFFY